MEAQLQSTLAAASLSSSYEGALECGEVASLEACQ